MSFPTLPPEIRNMIYSYLTPVYEEKVFKLKDFQEEPNDDSEQQHKDADIMRFNHETRQLFLVPYLRQFQAVVERGGIADMVDLDIYTDDFLRYFLRSGITHVAKYTCDYETGYGWADNGCEFASGIIKVQIAEDGEIEVSGEATCGDGSVDEWEWFDELEREIKRWVKADALGLISWDLMEYIDIGLEREIEYLRARWGDDAEEEEEMDESGATDDEIEAEDDESSSLVVAESSENEDDDSSYVTSEDDEDEEK
jgi:hypothetical protein